jgi:hypothetical protein
MWHGLTALDSACYATPMSAEPIKHHPSRIEFHLTPPKIPLLNPDVCAKLPRIEDFDPQLELFVQVKLIAPEIPSWGLYVVAFDGEDTVFGLWTSFYEARVGYFSLADLENAPETLGIGVQQDEHFEPTRLQTLCERYEMSLGDGLRGNAIT